jgi:hypothetical protein
VTYPSKMDSGIGSVLALVPVGLLLEAIFAIAPRRSGRRSVLIVYALAVFPTNYELTPDALKYGLG